MVRREFWAEVFALRGSVTPYVKLRVLIFGGLAAIVWLSLTQLGWHTGLGIAPYEVVGVVLALLLVLRTNAGYDRWYEGRKLWGGIVNQSRNLAIIGLEHGPADPKWRDQFVRWTAAFSHAARHSLRGERNLQDMVDLLGKSNVEKLAAAQHMPSYVVSQIARLLRDATEQGEMSRFAFLQAEHERNALIDHIGGCERIIKTPLAEVFSIKIRRFLFLYMLVLPFALVDKVGWLTPIITMMVSYPLLSLDQIGIELENPFSQRRLSHLPLNDICQTIETNVLALLDDSETLLNGDGGKLPRRAGASSRSSGQPAFVAAGNYAATPLDE